MRNDAYHTSQVSIVRCGMVAIEGEAEVESGFFNFTAAVAVVHHVNGGTVEFSLNISFSLDPHNDVLQNCG